MFTGSTGWERNQQMLNCEHGFAPNDGYCIPSGLYGEYCGISEECRVGSFLECLDKICVCDAKNGSYIWDPLQKVCVSLIGVECAPQGPFNRTCIDKSTCNNNICTCTGYDASPDKKRCVRGYEGLCNSNDDCADGLQCNADPTPTTTTVATTSAPSSGNPRSTKSFANIIARGKCGCSVEDEIYNRSTAQCDILPEKPCYNNRKQCVVNAQCMDNICKCTSQYLTENRKCVGNYGASCRDKWDCSSRNFLKCNTNNNRCECNENYEFNSITGKCIAPISSPCIDSGNCDGISSRCNSNTCQCVPGFVKSLNQSLVSTKCFATLSHFCSGASYCDPFRFMNCSPLFHICTCLNPVNQSFNTILDKCVAHAGTQCKLTDGEEMSCVENAICDTRSADGGVCHCEENFHALLGFCEENSATILSSFFLPLITLVGLVFKNFLQ